MAQVQFVDQVRNIRETRRMFAPSKATTAAWYKEARKSIPAIPNLKDSGWVILTEDVDLKWIKFTLRNPKGEKCHVVIDRQAPSFS